MSSADGSLEAGELPPLKFENDGSFFATYLQEEASKMRDEADRDRAAANQAACPGAATGPPAREGNGVAAEPTGRGVAAEPTGGPLPTAEAARGGPAAVPAKANPAAVILRSKRPIVKVRPRGGAEPGKRARVGALLPPSACTQCASDQTARKQRA